MSVVKRVLHDIHAADEASRSPAQGDARTLKSAYGSWYSRSTSSTVSRGTRFGRGPAARDRTARRSRAARSPAGRDQRRRRRPEIPKISAAGPASRDDPLRPRPQNHLLNLPRPLPSRAAGSGYRLILPPSRQRAIPEFHLKRTDHVFIEADRSCANDTPEKLA